MISTSRGRWTPSSLVPAVVAAAALVVMGTLANPSNAWARDVEFCDPHFGFHYEAQDVSLMYQVPQDCLNQAGVNKIDLKVSLERCAIDCTRQNEHVTCVPGRRCRGEFTFDHPSPERAQYVARLSYRSAGPTVLRGFRTHEDTCNSLVVESACF